MIFALCFLLLVILVLYVFVFNHLNRGLRVLMYHKISENINDKLTVSIDTFENQLLYIKNHNYQPITVDQLIKYQYKGDKLPYRPILITFDDGYENNYTYLYPLLKKYGLIATIFLPVGCLGKSNSWDNGNEEIMKYERLKEMDSAFVEFGLHSFDHVNYAELTKEELIDDIIKCKQKLIENEISFVPAIAYPYGAYPRDENKYEKYRKNLIESGILIGFRIGNRINKLPISDPFCVKRIDIKGSDSFFVFKIKMLFGRVKLF